MTKQKAAVDELRGLEANRKPIPERQVNVGKPAPEVKDMESSIAKELERFDNRAWAERAAKAKAEGRTQPKREPHVYDGHNILNRQNRISSGGQMRITANSVLFTDDGSVYAKYVGKRVLVTGRAEEVTSWAVVLTVGDKTVTCFMSDDLTKKRVGKHITIEGAVSSIADNHIYLRGGRLH